MRFWVVVWSKNVPACVQGYANRRLGIFYTFYFTFCAKMCACWSSFAQRMCPHASGVMPVGARGFFTHFISPFVQTCAILGRCLPNECARMRLGLCQSAPGDFLHILFLLLSTILRFWIAVCPKYVPACVQGYASRRPGIFYTFCLTFRANLCDFGSLFAQRMCPHASGVMPVQ